MDLNSLLSRPQFPLLSAKRSMAPGGKRAHQELARDHAGQIYVIRDALGVRPALAGPVT